MAPVLFFFCLLAFFLSRFLIFLPGARSPARHTPLEISTAALRGLPRAHEEQQGQQKQQQEAAQQKRAAHDTDDDASDVTIGQAIATATSALNAARRSRKRITGARGGTVGIDPGLGARRSPRLCDQDIVDGDVTLPVRPNRLTARLYSPMELRRDGVSGVGRDTEGGVQVDWANLDPRLPSSGLLLTGNGEDLGPARAVICAYLQGEGTQVTSDADI